MGVRPFTADASASLRLGPATSGDDEARDVPRVEVLSDKTISMRMLFDPGHSLEERILREQFGG